MAALTTPTRHELRAPREGDGVAVAALWRELWEVHEGWGGYAAARDVSVYEAVARRIEAEARVRYGQPVLGRHVHLLATYGGKPCGQVEGWFDRLGSAPTTPFTCEVRSLIVGADHRKAGLGRALLDELARWARRLARGAPVVLAAEVLEPNPAVRFYDRLEFVPVSRGSMVELATAAPRSGGGFVARRASPKDALPLAVLDQWLAARRDRQYDPRHDRPTGTVSPDAVRALTEYLTHGELESCVELVVEDAEGVVRGAATFATSTLEAPFRPGVRAVLSRLAWDPTADDDRVLCALLREGCDLARARGAERLEVTDLPPDDGALRDALGQVGARPWSRVVCRPARAGRVPGGLLRDASDGSV